MSIEHEKTFFPPSAEEKLSEAENGEQKAIDYGSVLAETQEAENIWSELKTEVNKCGHLVNAFQVYAQERLHEDNGESPTTSSPKRRIDFSANFKDYPDEILHVGKPENIPDNCRVVEGIAYGYEKRGLGRINSGIVDHQNRIVGLYFGSEEQREHFKWNHRGRELSKEYKNRLSDIHQMVFDYLRANPECHEKLKQFAHSRGWDAERVEEKLRSYTLANKFALFQFEKFLNETLALPDANAHDAAVLKKALERIGAWGIAEVVFAGSNAHDADLNGILSEQADADKKNLDDIKRALARASFQFGVKDLLGLAYVNIPENKSFVGQWHREFEKWRQDAGISKQELVDTGWYQLNFISKDEDRRGKPFYAFNGNVPVIRIPYFKVNERGEPSIVQWRTRHIVAEQVKRHKYTHSPKDRSLVDKKSIEQLLFQVGNDLENKERRHIKRALITEGEFKVAIAQLFLADSGTWVLGIPGITEVSPEIIDAIVKLNAEEVIVVFDADPQSKRDERGTYKTDSEFEARKLAMKLQRAGAGNVRVADLFDIAFVKVGIDDAILEIEQGEQKVERAIVDAKPEWALYASASQEELLKRDVYPMTFVQLTDRRQRVKKIIEEAKNAYLRGGEINIQRVETLENEYLPRIEEAYEAFLRNEYNVPRIDIPPEFLTTIYSGQMPRHEAKTVKDSAGEKFEVCSTDAKTGTFVRQDPSIYFKFAPIDFKSSDVYRKLSKKEADGITFLSADSATVEFLKNAKLEQSLHRAVSARNARTILGILQGVDLLYNLHFDVPAVKGDLEKLKKARFSSKDSHQKKGGKIAIAPSLADYPTLSHALQYIKTLSLNQLYSALAAEERSSGYSKKDYRYVPNVSFEEKKQGETEIRCEVPFALLSEKSNKTHRLVGIAGIIAKKPSGTWESAYRAQQIIYKEAKDFLIGPSKNEREKYHDLIETIIQGYGDLMKKKNRNGYREAHQLFEKNGIDIPLQNIQINHLMHITPEDMRDFQDEIRTKKLATTALNARLLKLYNKEHAPFFNSPVVFVPVLNKEGKWVGLKVVEMSEEKQQSMQLKNVYGKYGPSREIESHLYLEKNLHKAQEGTLYIVKSELQALELEPTLKAVVCLPEGELNDERLRKIIESRPKEIVFILPHSEERDDSLEEDVKKINAAANRFRSRNPGVKLLKSGVRVERYSS